MGNSCCQTQSQTSSKASYSTQRSIDTSSCFRELIQTNQSTYLFQEDDQIKSKLLSPRSQHVIVYLDPKIIIDEDIKQFSLKESILKKEHLMKNKKQVRFQD